jgi:hypothetical protein
MTTLLHNLWRGEIPLARAFWTYAIVYGGILNLLATAGAFALIADDAATPWVLVAYFLPVPYNVFVVIAVWRSAARYEGAQHWAELARIVIVVWVMALTAA